MIDALIVGAGPAGLSAAIQAVRQGLNITIVERDRPGGQARAANLIENYPGFPDGISGSELMDKLSDGASKHGIRVERGDVESIEWNESEFIIRAGGNEMRARSVIIATGLAPKRLGVPGEDELEGDGVYHYIDPSRVEHDDIDVAIIGSGDTAFDQALNFSRRARSVTIFMRAKAPSCAPFLLDRAVDAKIKIMQHCNVLKFRRNATSISIDLLIGGVRDKLEAGIISVCIGKEKHSDILSCKRDTLGLFYVGDCSRDKQGHIAIAAGDGIAAAMEIADYLKGIKTE